MILYVGLIVTGLAGVLSVRNSDIKEGESCVLPSAQHGQCRTILDCPNLDYGDTASWTFCKRTGFTKVVCCPDQKYKREAATTVQAMCEAIPRHVRRIYDWWTCGFGDYDQQAGGDEFPFMGLLVYDDDRWYDRTMRCGAALITSKLLLTAAHCFRKENATQVRFGTDHALDSSGETHEISRIILHPKYKWHPRLHSYDIAIVELSEEVDTRYFTPLCIHDSTEDLSTDENLTVLGWENPEWTDKVSHYLRKAAMKPVLHKSCKAKFPEKEINVTESHQCAEIKYPKYDSCMNFNGGPLVKLIDDKYYLVGITLNKVFWCEYYPIVYTRVASYLDWITEQVKALA